MKIDESREIQTTRGLNEEVGRKEELERTEENPLKILYEKMQQRRF